MNIQQMGAKLLGKRNELTSKECADQIKATTKRLEIIRARDLEISADLNGRGEFIGATRQRVAETGSPAELIRLDTEAELLEAEDSSLYAQRVALETRQKKAVIEESPALVKAAIKKLPAAMTAAEAAKVAYDQAISKLESLQTEIESGRSTALHGGQEHAGIAPAAGLACPSVSLELFERLAHCLKWYASDHPPAVGNLSRTLRRHRLTLTDFAPEREPIFQDISDIAVRDREAAAKKKAYLNQSNVPLIPGG